MEWITATTLGIAIGLTVIVAFWWWAISEAECQPDDHDWRPGEDDQHAYRLCNACGAIERFEHGDWVRVER